MQSVLLDFDPTTGELLTAKPVIETDPLNHLVFDLSAFTQAVNGGNAPGLKVNMNFPSIANVIANTANPPSQNTVPVAFTGSITLQGYAGFPDNVSLNLYYAKTGADTWDVAVYNTTDATPPNGFPFSNPPLGQTTLKFDMGTGELISGGDLSITLPDGAIFPVDLSDSMSVADSNLMDNEGVFASLNLPSSAPTIRPSVAGLTPAKNTANSAYSHKTSLISYDDQGAPVTLDVYFTKGTDFNWEVAVFNRADASPNGGFPYGTAGSAPLATSLMRFDPQNGTLLEGGDVEIAIPGGQTMLLDLTASTQRAGDYQIATAELNGNPPSATVETVIGEDGVVYDRSARGDMLARYQLAVATVASPDRMTVISGNVFSASAESGDVVLGTATANGNGTIRTGALENSNADIAQELTDMIEAQRSYTANSKVFQTGSELMDVLVNLKR
ncbi:flagellar hook-basal body complex protein [Ochrobactrum sp. MYb379]